MMIRCFSPGHLVLQMQPHVTSFYGVTSRIRFMFLLFPQVSRNWSYESEPPLKPSHLTYYKQFGTNSIIVLMFVESQRVTYRAPVSYVTKTWSVVLLNKKYIYSYLKFIVHDKLLKPRQSFRVTLYFSRIHFNVGIYLKTNLWSRLILLGYQNKFLRNSGFPMKTRSP